MCTNADFDRDYLFPSPTTNCNGCHPSELRYDTAYAMQNGVLYSLQKEGNAVFSRVSTSFWTPHSARAFLPSCTKALGVAQGRTRLFGWMERTRQRHVYTCSGPRHLESSASRHTGLDREAERRPLGRRGDHPSIRILHVRERSWRPEDRAKCFKQLGKDSVSIPVARTPELAVEEVGPLNPSEAIPETEQLAEMAQDEPRADKRLKSESSRTQVLGDNPKEVRDCARRLLEPGYYVSASGRSATRILHFLGDCYMIPGIDYFRCQYSGQLMPSISEFDGVCKLCSKKGSVRVHESSGTETSSSTSRHLSGIGTWR